MAVCVCVCLSTPNAPGRTSGTRPASILIKNLNKQATKIIYFLTFFTRNELIGSIYLFFYSLIKWNWYQILPLLGNLFNKQYINYNK